MTIKEKLKAMKAIVDKNRAVDEAFVLGQKSVPPMREFTTEELRMLRELIVKASGKQCERALFIIYTKIRNEITRRNQTEGG